MSGMLKRKLEEGPSSYLSLQGSDDDAASYTDSGNSSDSLNHSVPSGLLDCKISPPFVPPIKKHKTVLAEFLSLYCSVGSS